MGTVPLPSSAVAGTVATAALLNSFRDCINFWAGRPVCLAYQATAQAFTTTNTTYVVSLDAETIDVVQAGDSPGHDNSSNNSRIYARTPGIYRVGGQVSFAADINGNRYGSIKMNGATTLSSSQAGAVSSTSATSVSLIDTYVRMSAGDYLELNALHTAGHSLNSQPALNYTFMYAEWVAL